MLLQGLKVSNSLLIFIYLFIETIADCQAQRSYSLLALNEWPFWLELNPAHVHVGVCFVSQLRGGGTGVVTLLK